MQINPKQKTFFTQKLLEWNAKQNDRKMPWKEIKNPYFIWLSEIILQQTRVEQGLPYYLKFIEQYPEINDLAKAPEDEVMRLWQGLGYYSRARNLQAAAQYIVEEKKGIFPKTYEEILKLKGVGPYTAAAIASFAYDLPYAVLDGNVFRVLSRFFGIETPIDSTEGKKQFTKLANERLDEKQAATYTQAIMDFGAKQCSPAKPLCMFCPLQQNCTAYLQAKVSLLPIKEKKIKKKERYLYYLFIEGKQSFYIKKRTEKGIWQNLYDLPLIEESKVLEEAELKEALKKKLKRPIKEKLEVSKEYIHLLTHQKIHVWFVKVKKIGKKQENAWKLIKLDEIDAFPFPKVILKFFADMEMLY